MEKTDFLKLLKDFEVEVARTIYNLNANGVDTNLIREFINEARGALDKIENKPVSCVEEGIREILGEYPDIVLAILDYNGLYLDPDDIDTFWLMPFENVLFNEIIVVDGIGLYLNCEEEDGTILEIERATDEEIEAMKKAMEEGLKTPGWLGIVNALKLSLPTIDAQELKEVIQEGLNSLKQGKAMRIKKDWGESYYGAYVVPLNTKKLDLRKLYC